jgi:hypothetical protein
LTPVRRRKYHHLTTGAGIGAMKIRGYPKWQRIYAACVFGLAGIFFAWLYSSYRKAEGSWIGLILMAACFWVALYWVCLPRILGELTPEGINYLNEDLGFLFYYPWFHIDWNRVTEIRTFEKEGGSAAVMVTVVRATDAKDTQKMHTFRIDSNNMDYDRVLEYIKTVADPATFEGKDSLPLDPALLRSKLQGDMRHRFASLIVTILILLGFLYFTRR